LSTFQDKFNSISLPPNTYFIHIKELNADITRRVIYLSDSTKDDTSTFIASLPGNIFFSQRCRHYLQEFVTNERNYTNSSNLIVTTLLGSTIMLNGIWINAGNDLNGNNTQQRGVYTVYFAFQLPEYTMTWRYFKFLFRCLFSSCTAYFVWRQYYRHYLQLKSNLSNNAIRHEKLQFIEVVKYEILVGDPTSIVLFNPLIAIIFSLDIYLSPEILSRSLCRLTQVDDIGLFLVSSLYLSRAIWYSFGSLSLLSLLLKRWHKEKWFCAIDPGLMTVFVAIMVGPFTWLQAKILAYAAMLVIMPISYGFNIKKIRKHCKCIAKVRNMDSQLMLPVFSNNDIKHHIILMLSTLASFPWRQLKSPTSIGGTVYQLFELSPQFKRNLTMSQRGADSYVLCYSTSDIAVVSIRLSLLDCIDLKNPNISIISGKGNVVSQAFGFLQINSTQDKVTLEMGSNGSRWIM